MARFQNAASAIRGAESGAAGLAAGTRALGGKSRPVGLPQVYRGRGRRTISDIYDADHGTSPPGGRFRWLFSTVLAATVGSIAIFVVLYGSTDSRDTADNLMPALMSMSDGNMPAVITPRIRQLEGLNWSIPKSDRIQATVGAASTRFVIHDMIKQRRNGREYIYAKPFVRVVARLAPPPDSAAASIPAFNPLRLYADADPAGDASGETEVGSSKDVTIRVVELLGGILPSEDGQALELSEIGDIIVRAEEAVRLPEIEPQPEEVGEASLRALQPAPNTTILQKSTVDDIDTIAESDSDDGEVNVVRVGRGERLEQILVRGGADRWQAKAMVEAARGIFKDADLEPGLEVHLTTVATLDGAGGKELARFSIYADGHVHKVTVRRSASGDFEASARPLGSEAAMRAIVSSGDDGDNVRSSSLYAGLYYALTTQNVPKDTIQQLLKVHAYDKDYRRRLRAGDQIELFFDVREEHEAELQVGELLYSAITAGGETSRFYRFRTSDGAVDYFDEQGNHSKRFLMRRPVRGNDVRLTSGFGYRFHPLLNERKMHTGVDWAAPPGTPIVASGHGVIEQSGRKGAYGNYIRIRHANGYQTTYAHMSRIAPAAVEGAKVRQGQVIGYVGSTGLSSGPHLHFEVLVNTRFVNPMSIQVPRERQLDGRQRGEFFKERARIEELMHRAPVMSASR